MSQDTKKDVLLGLFIGSMVIVNTLGIKITTIFGVRVSVGIFFVPVMFLITDIVGEVYGNREAQKFVNISIGMLVFLIVMTKLCIGIKPNDSWTFQNEYSLIFGSTIRMTAASLISFVISQKLDVVMFGFFRRLSNGKHLWIRNNISTITAQFIDTTIFEFIAFYHITPQYNARFIFSLILPYWSFKVIFALLDTPFCYLGVRWLKGSLPNN